MILKVEGPKSGGKQRGVENGWVVWGEVIRCDYSKSTYDEATNSYYDVSLLGSCEENQKWDAGAIVMVVNIETKHDGNIVIITDGQCYLCNDEGKTLERIY